MNLLQLQEYFETLIQCVATAYMTICLILCFVKSPKDAIYRPYRQSKRMLTVAFGSMSLNLVAWCVLTTGSWAKFNYAIACIDIVLFYFEELLLCYSFCHILNNSFITKRRLLKDAAQMSVSTVLAVMSLFPALAGSRMTLLMVSLAVMMENIVELAFLFHKQYKLNGELLDNYFSTDMHKFVRWTNTSIILLIISWVMALVTMFTNVLVNWAFQLYMVPLNIFIAVSFINFAAKYGDIAKAYQSADNTADNAADEAAQPSASADDDIKRNTLEQKIKTWVDTKKYIGTQFTIDELASTLGTNKNYLSYFINERYGMNFSAWVSSLRIEEAKQMMRAKPEQKLEEVAYFVGFSSPSYFSKVFSLHEGVSPTVWRRSITK